MFSWLSKFARPFWIPGRNVEIIYTPDVYFEALKNGVRSAKKRIMYSSLYLGTGKREAELVDVMRSALSDNSRPGMECTLLLDHLRGSRGHPNSMGMVQDLAVKYVDRFKLFLYHTPNLRGVLRKYGPERFNEVMGLQHMKIFLFDDDLILSGANMSRDYFVDRQDRYIWFKNCPELVDFFAKLLNVTTAHSYSLKPDGSTMKPTALQTDPLLSRKTAQEFKYSLEAAIIELVQPIHVYSSSETETKTEALDTVVYPLIQMGQYNIIQDEVVTQLLLQDLKENEKIYLASGYFNLPPQYSQAILTGKGEYNILASSPQANGFYGAKGVAGHVPVMYIHFAKKFLQTVSKVGFQDRISYFEYDRRGWTFHGKGLWYYPAGEKWPTLSLIGSSNYGHRSLTRDLEAQVAMVTQNEVLRKSLHEEQGRMFEYGKRLSLKDATTDPSRKLNFLEWLATTILKPHV